MSGAPPRGQEGRPGADPTRRETPASAGRRPGAPGPGDARTRRERAAAAGRRSRRLHLPQTVAARYDYLHDLQAAGGEADLALLRDRTSGAQAIFKSYRAGMAPDPVAMEILRTADPRHVVRLIEVHDGADGAWEIQEHCPLGSLRDWVASRDGRLDKSVLTDVVRGVAGALQYIHGLESGVAHRDIKPSNVLVRSEEPLELVLTDFGLAKAGQSITHLTTTAKGTWHYAAPEVHAKQSSTKSDWFSLGAMIYEFYTGRQLFAMDDGTEVTGDDAKARSMAGNYSTHLIDDARWKLLADGLLTWDKDHRWAADQVEAWLRGESPSVHSRPAGTRSGAARNLKYALPGIPTLVGTPVQLAELLRAHWEDASGLLAGRPDPKMIRFLEGFPEMKAAVRIVNSAEGPGSKLVQLQGILDPERPIHFDRVPLDAEALQEQISAADTGDKRARDWLRALVEERILLAYAEVTGSQQALDADHLLQAWKAQAVETARLVCSGRRPVVGLLRDSGEAAEIGRALTGKPKMFAEDAFQEVLPELVAQALREPESRTGSWLTQAARAAAPTGTTSDWPWSKELATSVQRAPDTDLGLMLVSRVALGLTTQWAELRRSAEEAEAQRQAEAERARRAEEQKRQDEERRRQEWERSQARAEAERWWTRKIAEEEKHRQGATMDRARRAREETEQAIAELKRRRDREISATSGSFYSDDWSPGAIIGATVIGAPLVAFGLQFLFASFGLLYWLDQWFGWFMLVYFGLGAAWFTFSLGGLLQAAKDARRSRKIKEKYDPEISKVEAAAASKVIGSVIKIVQIPTDKITRVIGPRGATIKGIESATKTAIELEDWQVGPTRYQSSYGRDRAQKWFDWAPTPVEQGITVAVIAAESEQAAKSALLRIGEIVNPRLPEVGMQYEGTVARLMPYGAFITVLPGIDGLLHISRLNHLNQGNPVQNLEEILAPGQRVRVRVSEVRAEGKLSLSLAP